MTVTISFIRDKMGDSIVIAKYTKEKSIVHEEPHENGLDLNSSSIAKKTSKIPIALYRQYSKIDNSVDAQATAVTNTVSIRVKSLSTGNLNKLHKSSCFDDFLAQRGFRDTLPLHNSSFSSGFGPFEVKQRPKSNDHSFSISSGIDSSTKAIRNGNGSVSCSHNFNRSNFASNFNHSNFSVDHSNPKRRLSNHNKSFSVCTSGVRQNSLETGYRKSSLDTGYRQSSIEIGRRQSSLESGYRQSSLESGYRPDSLEDTFRQDSLENNHQHHHHPGDISFCESVCTTVTSSRDNTTSRRRFEINHANHDRGSSTYQTPTQRKNEHIRELRAKVKGLVKYMGEKDDEIVRLKTTSDLHTSLILEAKNEDMRTTTEELTTLRRQNLELSRQNTELQNTISVLQGKIDTLKESMEARDKEHETILLQMYQKGMAIARRQREDELVEESNSGPQPHCTMHELLEKLTVTEQNLSKWQSLRTQEVYHEAPFPATEADATLRFLRDSFFHYLTAPANSDDHLRAMIRIFSFTDVQRKKIAKAVLKGKKK